MPVSAYNATQVERLREIGRYLQQVREERRLSLEEVSAHTRIQVRLLRALEAGDVAELPEPIYVQGFLRQYATVLELKDLDLSELDLASPLTKPPTVRGEMRSPLRPFHLYITYFALILGAIAVLSYVLRSSNSSSSKSVAPAPSPTAVTPSPPIAVSPSPQVSPTSPPVRSKPAELRVQVELTGESWLRVVADGQVVFEGTLNLGATETWSAKQTLVLVAGNAGEVRVRVNEGAPQPLGEPGEVKEVTLTLDKPTLPTPPL